jgi:transcriptional regulator with XRE-family HTH domain
VPKPRTPPRPAPFGRPVALPGPLGELARAVGGTSELAERLGVTPRTLQRWASGTRVPSKPVCLLLARFAKEIGLSLALQSALEGLHPAAPTKSVKHRVRS